MLRPVADVPYPLHEWSPGAKGVYRGLPLEINSSGFIGPGYSRDPADGVMRIMVIGDSIAAGLGLESLSDSFANELEGRLTNSGTAVEVLNLAVPGYDARLGIGHFDYAMRRFASLAQQNGFRTLVVRVPYLSSRENEGRRLAEKIVAYILDKYHLPHLDLNEAYRSIGYRKLQHVDWDRIHPNARGHAELARLVASSIEHGTQ